MKSRFAHSFMSLKARFRPAMPGPSPDELESQAARTLAANRGRSAAKPPPNASRAINALMRLVGQEETGAGGGLGLNELTRRWAHIAGAPFAGKVSPTKLSGGVLTISVPGALAPLVQQQAALLMERVNLAGARVKSVKIEHRTRAPAPAGNVKKLKRPLEPAEEAAIAAGLSEVADPRLKAALMRLGRAVRQG